MRDGTNTLREEIAEVAPFANTDETGRYDGEVNE
jgi:hypothetical protein